MHTGGYCKWDYWDKRTLRFLYFRRAMKCKKNHILTQSLVKTKA